MKQATISIMLLLLHSAGLICGCESSTAPKPALEIKRTELQRHDLRDPEKESIQVRIDFDPAAAFGKHSHPGEELIYVLDGLFEYEVEGRPTVTLKKGDVLFIPAGTIHAAKNIGTTTATELATYIVEKGKQLVVIAR